jgi:hypothetical protein
LDWAQRWRWRNRPNLRHNLRPNRDNARCNLDNNRRRSRPSLDSVKVKLNPTNNARAKAARPGARQADKEHA